MGSEMCIRDSLGHDLDQVLGFGEPCLTDGLGGSFYNQIDLFGGEDRVGQVLAAAARSVQPVDQILGPARVELLYI